MNGHEASNAQIADAWIDYYRRHPVNRQPIVHEDDPAWWAISVIMHLEISDPMRTLEIAFAIARESVNEWVLENLGSGPLETMLGRNPTLLDTIEIEAAASPGLRKALRSVWSSSMPEEVKVALKHLTGR